MVKKSTRKALVTIGVLFSVLFALGGLVTWDNWKTEKEKGEEKSKNKIVEFKATDVTEIDYADAALKATLVKKDGTWRLTQPVDALADAGAVDAMLTSLVDYSYAKVIADTKDKWGEYGVDQPDRTVTLKAGNDKPSERTIYVGKKAPAGFNIYFRLSGDDKVYMGSQHLLTATGKTLFELRDKTFVKIDASKLKSISYGRTGTPTIDMQRDAGTWKITQPTPLAADSDEIAALVDDLSSVRVAGFEEPPPPEIAKAFVKPGITISWTTESGETSKALFAQVGDKIYGAFDPAVRIFGLPGDFKAKVEKGLKDLRNRRVLQIDASDVAKVTVDGETFDNVDGVWYLPADVEKARTAKTDKDKPSEAAHIRVLIVDLEFARADDFISPDAPEAKALASAPEHRIQLAFKDPAKPGVALDLFPAPGEGVKDKYLVRRSDSETIYRVPRKVFASMKPGAEPAAGSTLDGENSANPLDDDGLNLDEGMLPDEPATEKPPTG